MSTPLRFELVLTATAEVRDKDGNLISNTPVETTALVTEQEAAELMAQMEASRADQ